MNLSKKRSSRHWDKMRAAGSVEGIGAAHRCAALARVNTGPSFEAETEIKLSPTPGVGDPAYFGSATPVPAGFTVKAKAGWSMDAIEMADALEADEPTPFGRPSELADAITREEDARIAATVVVSPTVPEFVTVPQAARALGVHPTTVRRRLARGTYEGILNGPTWVITDIDIREAVVRHALED